MTSKFKQWALAGAATAAIASGALAQDDPAEPARTPEERPLYNSTGEDGAFRERIIVTGTNIGGLTPESIPVEVYTAEDIRELGATNLQQFARLVPQNLASLNAQTVGSGFNTNVDGTTAFDLRGLGVGSTLTLINGRRLALSGQSHNAADLSILPLAAVDRVEILTDGASSIYGSDAVAGVVNLITRSDFDGAETNLQYETTTDGGYEVGRIDQLLGTSWSGGNVLGSLSYSTSSPLKALDRDYVAPQAASFYLTPVEQSYSGFLTGQQELSSQFKVFGDLLYTDREVKSSLLSQNLPSIGRLSTQQYFVNAGARYQFNDDIGAEVGATYSDVESEATTDTPPLPPFDTEVLSSALDLSAKVDGNLFELWNGADVMFVAGGGYLTETFDSLSLPDEAERETAYGFAEVQIPLIAPSQNLPFAEYFDINISGRYTEIKDIDESFDPKVGLTWAISSAVKLRATYSESFRAPSLSDLNRDTNLIALAQAGDVLPIFGIPVADPFPGGDTVLLTVGAGNTSLTPETSENITVGFDLTPVPGLEISATYYDIDYTDRIQNVPVPPGAFAVMMLPGLLPDIIRTDFTQADMESIVAGNAGQPLRLLTPNAPQIDLTDPAALFGATDVIVDGRIANMASAQTNGLDLSLDYSTDTSFGRMSFGGLGTFIFELDQRQTPTGQVLDILNTVYNPVDFRGRAYLGIAQGPWNARANLNYVNSYQIAPDDETEMDSWTTLDLLAGYRFESIGPLGGLLVSANVKNVFDEDPPFLPHTAIPTSNRLVGYDAHNADPLGRVMGLQLTQTW